MSTYDRRVVNSCKFIVSGSGAFRSLDRRGQKFGDGWGHDGRRPDNLERGRRTGDQGGGNGDWETGYN
jgi:hypothetical protein